MTTEYFYQSLRTTPFPFRDQVNYILVLEYNWRVRQIYTDEQYVRAVQNYIHYCKSIGIFTPQNFPIFVESLQNVEREIRDRYDAAEGLLQLSQSA